MKIKLSIIVPLYNTGKLLSTCLDSILAQTFEHFELILVNDGSTDNSGEICNDYANKDRRVKVIHKKNGGTSSARNAGLEIAKGDYIGFVDSDDYINKYMYEKLYKNAIKHSSDIVLCRYKEVYGFENNLINNTVEEKDAQHFINLSAIKQMYVNKSTYIAYVVPWNKLYKRQLFENIRYETGNIYDDETVAHKLLYESKKITVITSSLYFYNQREGSQMNSSFHIKRFDKIYALKEREKYFRDRGELDIHQDALMHYMDMFFWYYYLAKSNLTDIDKELKKLKGTFNNSLIQLLKLKKISRRQKFMLILFYVSPYLYESFRDIKLKGKTVH